MAEMFSIQDFKRILKTEGKDFILATEENSIIFTNNDLIGLSDLYVQELGYTEYEALQIELGAIKFYTNN